MKSVFFVLVLAVANFLSFECWAKDWKCGDVYTGEAYNCEGMGCKIQKVRPGQGYCATATEFVIKDLNPGEQMCCTQMEAIVRAVPPGQTLVCNRFEAVIYSVDHSNLERDEQVCCKHSECVSRTINHFNYEKLGCTASKSVVVINPGPNFAVACTNNQCFRVAIKEGEQMACKRFNNLPVAENELKSFGREVEKVAGFLNSKERCKQDPFHGEFTRDSGERTADQNYQTDSYASVCSNP